MTIEAKAKEAGQWFTTKTRGDQTIFVLRPDAPEWVTDLVRAAHENGAILPDDWRYAMIVSALASIADGNTEDDDHDFANGASDTYNAYLSSWLGSLAERGEYVNEAVREFGAPDPFDIWDAIRRGQSLETSEIYRQVWRALEEAEV